MEQGKPPAPDHAGDTSGTTAGEPATTENAADTRVEVELDLDNYVLEWFRAQGENYEDLMNQVLHDYIAAEDAAASQAEAEPDGE